MQQAMPQRKPAQDPGSVPLPQRRGPLTLAGGEFTHPPRLQQQHDTATLLHASAALVAQRQQVDLIRNSPRHAAQQAVARSLNPCLNAAVAQRAAPTPVTEGNTAFNDAYKDNDTDVQFTKLHGDQYLLKGRIIKWADPNYKNLAGEVINLTEAAALEEQDADVLDVGQGEIGYLANAEGPFKKIRSTNASPCVIITIHDTQARKTLLAHIHRKNKVSDVLQDAQAKFGENNGDLAVKLTTLEFVDADNLDRQTEERAAQARIATEIKNTIEDYLFVFDAGTIVEDKAHENAMINSADGSVTNPLDSAVEASRGRIGALRGLKIEADWGAEAQDNSKGFKSRTANVVGADAAAFQLKPVVQRKIFIGKQQQTAGELGDLGAPWNAKIDDPIERQFVDRPELDRYKAHQTTHIGTLRKALADGVWVRFDPAQKYVLGESHGGIVLSDFTRAVKSQNFQHERFSRLAQIKDEGYTKLAKKTEDMNDGRYALYGVDMKTDEDINRYALESPMPKIAYCLNEIAQGLNPDTNTVHGNGYSLIDRYTQYLMLSFTIVEDLLAHVDLRKQDAINKTCLKTVLTDIASGELQYEKAKAAAEKIPSHKPKEDEEAALLLYCRTFVLDTLKQANQYADRTADPTSNLVKRKQRDMGDLTNPSDEPTSEALSYLRDEEMVNHLREDVQYVGMGNAHSVRLQPRLEERRFRVIHVPSENFGAKTKEL